MRKTVVLAFASFVAAYDITKHSTRLTNEHETAVHTGTKPELHRITIPKRLNQKKTPVIVKDTKLDSASEEVSRQTKKAAAKSAATDNADFDEQAFFKNLIADNLSSYTQDDGTDKADAVLSALASKKSAAHGKTVHERHDKRMLRQSPSRFVSHSDALASDNTLRRARPVSTPRAIRTKPVVHRAQTSLEDIKAQLADITKTTAHILSVLQSREHRYAASSLTAPNKRKGIVEPEDRVIGRKPRAPARPGLRSRDLARASLL